MVNDGLGSVVYLYLYLSLYFLLSKNRKLTPFMREYPKNVDSGLPPKMGKFAVNIGLFPMAYVSP